MPKNNIRSMRFSDRMIEIIEQQAGDNFTQKFEALVTRCMWELPEAERRLEEINIQIRNQRFKLNQLIAVYNKISRSAEVIEETIDGICKELDV